MGRGRAGGRQLVSPDLSAHTGSPDEGPGTRWRHREARWRCPWSQRELPPVTHPEWKHLIKPDSCSQESCS